MKLQSRLRNAFDESAAESIKTNILNKIPQELKDKLHSEGGDIEVDIDKNSFTINGCSKALSDEIGSMFIRKKLFDNT